MSDEDVSVGNCRSSRCWIGILAYLKHCDRPATPIANSRTGVDFRHFTFWNLLVLYIVIRYEKQPLPYILLAFIPYFSLGYYFERVRGRQMVSPMQDRDI